MSHQSDKESSTSSQVLVEHKLVEQPEKRQITLSRKALQNAVEIKRLEADSKYRYLQSLLRKEHQGDKKYLSELVAATEEYKLVINELTCLYEQDKYGEFKDEALLTEEQRTINYAHMVVERIKNRHSDKLSETSSRGAKSHRSHSRSSFSISSSVRLRALAEAAAAQENAEYERVIAEKEHERSQREAEHAKDMAILTAHKKTAVANAKLKAIENAIREEEMPERVEIPDIPIMPTEKRTNDWVHSTHASESVRPRLNDIKHDIDRLSPKNLGHSLSRAPGQSFVVQSTPIQLIETLTSANQQMVTGLARQSLPKCHPDTFKGDATLFHPWKKAFKAMIRDADVSAEQEINYLRSFTSGEVQRVVDNFRKRQQNEPVVLLQSLWKELEKRFGSAAVITNVLLERLHESAAFGANDNVKLQEFADLCVDVSSQLDYLPGLACLNYPAAIRPIVWKLPVSLRTKWERQVVKYAERNQDAYPGFRNFARVVENEATHKNHPNIIAGNPLTPPIPPRRKEKSDERRILLTNTQLDEKEATQPKGKPRCPYHERDGHGLTECKAFAAKSLNEKTEWIQKAGLCFRCLSETHRARDCKVNTSCSICGEACHIALLHRDKDKEVTSPKDKETKSPEDITSKCTAVCGEGGGGVSCSKVVLVDIFDKTKPHATRRVYAILDDQSNSSLISSELADTLGADGPEEKYYLSTCGGDRETKYGRRVTGLVARSALNGRMSDLPTLVECDHIPEDVREIPTPEVARRFPHLEEIANEIPPFDKDAGIHILLGRDAPELLKVRAFKNGPRAAPWAQKLSLGWTVTGQVCLDLLDGPVHIQARKTSVKVDSDTKWLTNSIHATRENKETACVKINGEEYDVMPCPNKLKITDSFNDHDVFHSTPSDNEVSLSCDDRKFLEIMENEIHKNASGNWEMPLPFRCGNAVMPNNRVQAVNRLNSLLKTLKRKPQMEKDYLEFMQKVIDKSHASSVPPEEIQAQSGRVWYLPHFGIYHPKKPTQIRVVFDSSAEFQGVSLNKELLAGPDLMNSLLGVLIRFRKENVAVMCDIEQMFHSFYVNPAHRDYLRFLWYQDNDPQKPVTEYRMNVHLFGNGPSPAVASFGLRKTAAQGEEVKNFVHRNFYVDDGLASLPTVQEAVDLVRNAQSILATSNLRSHGSISYDRQSKRSPRLGPSSRHPSRSAVAWSLLEP